MADSNYPLFTPRSSGSGGGGGSSLVWEEIGLSPFSDFENNVAVYFYQAALSQNLYTAIRVPTNYNQGAPITLYIEWYSPDTSGTGLLRAQSTLIRAEVDQMSSTTNQRTTTNSAVTLSAGTANEPQKITLDITDTNGQINGVSPSPGDLIIVRLYRDTDTATSEIRFIKMSTEVTFT